MLVRVFGGELMLSRFSVAAVLAILGILATSAVAFAAGNSDRDEVIAGTALVCLGLVLLASMAYMMKLVFGAEKQLVEPEINDDNGGSR